MEVSGQSGWFCLVEYSCLLEIYIDETFHQGDDIPVITTNIKITGEVEITETLFSVYRSVLLSSIKVYEKEIQETWKIPADGTKTWYWDQKDQNGKQVSKGDYTIAGEFTINGRVHPISMSFEIKKKGKNKLDIQTLLIQILNGIFKPAVFSFIEFGFVK